MTFFCPRYLRRCLVQHALGQGCLFEQTVNTGKLFFGKDRIRLGLRRLRLHSGERQFDTLRIDRDERLAS